MMMHLPILYLLFCGTLATFDVTWTPLLGDSSIYEWTSIHLDPSDTPGKRAHHSMRLDDLGNVWMYGGAEYRGGDSEYVYDDLWILLPNLTWWYVMGESGLRYRHSWYYDTVRHICPGGLRSYASWIPDGSTFFIFGGFSAYPSREFNRKGMWNFTLDSKRWMVLDTIDTTDRPNPRFGSITWTRDGRMYLFGGKSIEGYHLDIWFYTSEDGWRKEWSREVNSKGNYTHHREFSIHSYPSARIYTTSWLDRDGNMWIYGGMDALHGILSDMWMYGWNGTWMWIDGYSGYGHGHVRPSYGVASQLCVGNTPGDREGSASWIGPNNTLWLFGGGSASKISGIKRTHSDLWAFDTASLRWAYVSGNKSINVLGNYGSNPYPGSRKFMAYWNPDNQTFYLHGGRASFDVDSNTFECKIECDATIQDGVLSDLWRADIVGTFDDCEGKKVE